MVELPRRVRRFVEESAEAVRRSVDDPSAPAFARLYGQLDESAVHGDPLVTLERQTVIDEVCRIVTESARKDRLSDAEADAWLRVLGMAVALVAATAGLATDDDVERLDPGRARHLDLLRSLQLLVAQSLDPTLTR